LVVEFRVSRHGVLGWVEAKSFEREMGKAAVAVALRGLFRLPGLVALGFRADTLRSVIKGRN